MLTGWRAADMLQCNILPLKEQFIDLNHIQIILVFCGLVRVIMFGFGYAVLMPRACFTDIDPDMVCGAECASQVEWLKAGVISFCKKGLFEQVSGNYDVELPSSTKELAQGLKGVSIVCIAVDTPPRHGGADIKAIHSVAKEVDDSLKIPAVIDTLGCAAQWSGDARVNIQAERQQHAQCAVERAGMPEGQRVGASPDPEGIEIAMPLILDAVANESAYVEIKSVDGAVSLLNGMYSAR